MKISVICPVKNEVDFIGYSVMAILPYVHEIVYTCAESTDGTDELLEHIRTKYAKDKLKLHYQIEPSEIGERAGNFDFDPLDMRAYNAAYNYAIGQATGDAVWFLHPDMIVTNPEMITTIEDGPLAWFTHVDSYARDLQTEIVKGRSKRWKNIHAKQFGLHYYGGYGSANEDFYHRDITGNSYRHFGTDFAEYPFEVGDSKIEINHYCELKTYDRRLEKMVRCLKTQNPGMPEDRIHELAKRHPRVTLESANRQFGQFDFQPSTKPVPSVFAKYKKEFETFKKELVHA
jgi:glycosyltransferase involved in cell wall biosynthesis